MSRANEKSGALQKNSSEAPLSALRRVNGYLKSLMSESGGFSYVPGNEPSLEATAWCGLALAKESETIRRQVCGFLIGNQNKDGGWPTAPGAGFSDWVTGPVLLSLRTLKTSRQDRDRKLDRSIIAGLHHLNDSRVDFHIPIARLLILLSKGVEGLKYARGWPWDPDCFHWVEPTSYHLLALKLPDLPDIEVYGRIVEFANKFLLKHACTSGGWNHGSNICLGVHYTAYRLTTAEALTALQDLRGEAKVEKAIEILKSFQQEDSSALALAWSVIALDAYDRNFEQELSFLISRQKEDGSFGTNIMANAMASLALAAATGDNRLKIRRQQGGIG